MRSFWGLGMKKSLALGIGAIALGGCALPVPLQVASWALDGISYLATDKSMTDHGLSMVAQQDCALLRGLTEGSVCKNWDDAATLVADAGGDGPERLAVTPPTVRIGYAASAHSDIPPLNTDIDDAMPNVEMLANFDTAAGSDERVQAPPRQAMRPELTPAPKAVRARIKTTLKAAAPMRPRTVTPRRQTVSLPVTAMAELPIPAVAPSTALRFAATARDEPVAGVYYVIGSFRNFINARSFAGQYEQLVPEVLAAKLDGAPVYRVVVGPVRSGREKSVYRRVATAGLKDSWAIRVVPGDWLLARRVIERKRRIGIGQELAHATR